MHLEVVPWLIRVFYHENFSMQECRTRQHYLMRAKYFQCKCSDNSFMVARINVSVVTGHACSFVDYNIREITIQSKGLLSM